MGHEMWHSMACKFETKCGFVLSEQVRVFLPQRKLKQLNMVSTLTDYLALLWAHN